MTFEEALILLAKGHRVISKKDKLAFENQFLKINKKGVILYMNEPWTPTPAWLLEYMHDEWIDVELDCDYHDCDRHNCENKEIK